MANAYYNNSMGEFARGNIPWVTADIRTVLVDAALYTFSAAHDFLSSVPAGSRVATLSASLSGKSVADDGSMDSDDFTWSSVPAGSAAEAIVYYVHTGSDATARLIAYIDTGYTGLPVTPDGNNITVTQPSGGPLKLDPS